MKDLFVPPSGGQEVSNEQRHLESNRKKWKRWAGVADSNGRLYEYLRQAQAAVLRQASISENKNFLDIGCGTGWAVGEAARMAGYKGSFYGVDLSEDMISKARTNFKSYENITFFTANAEDIPLPGGIFDTIICTNSFHHYLRPVTVINEMSRLLKPGGKLYILDPVSDTLIVRIADRIIRFIEPQHVKIYSSIEYRDMMTAAGLKYTGTIPSIKGEKIQTAEK